MLCHVGGTEEPGLVLIHHMDVVPAKAEEWTVPPFSAEVRDGFLYGRGTLDTKGLGVAHWCAALRAAKAGILRRKLFLVANADEEVGGGEGAEYFVRNLPFPIGAAYGMNEGGVGVTDIFGGGGKFFLLNMWEKGPVWMKLSAAGRAGHGSRPSAKDAPARLARAMARVAEFREPARLTEPVRDMLRVLRAKGSRTSTSTPCGAAPKRVGAGGPRRPVPRDRPAAAEHFAVTTLAAGFKPNVIPSSAEGTIDARIVPGEEPEAVAARVRTLVADLDVSVEILFAEKPNGSPMGPLYGAMEAAVLAVHPDAVVVPYMSTGFTDSRFFRSIGIPTYGLMPLLLPRAEHGKIHGVDERIPVGGIEEMTRIVYKLIEGWNA